MTEHEHHIIPTKTLVTTLCALLVLTVITVAISYVNFGALGNIIVAMAIASFKACLVMTIFMGLKWDSWFNRLSLVFGVLCLGVFLWLTASDLWFRLDHKPVKVVQAAASISMADIKKIQSPSAELVAKGKELYAINCVACHGAAGKGDGPAGGALSPKPRNFTHASAKWTNGTSVKSIYVSLSKGVPGTGMAGYAILKPSDRFALVHYVRSMVPDAESSSKKDGQFASVLKADGVGAGGSSKKTVPVDFAIDQMLKKN